MNAKILVWFVPAAGFAAVGILTMADSGQAPPASQYRAGPPVELADRESSDILLGPLGTGFTYQGLLKRSGTPCFGTCDLQFSLWDAESAGEQIGTTQTLTAVSLTNGQFGVQLNNADQFGASAFNGDARWLEIAVRHPAGSGAYTPVSPRTKVTAAPYAHHAMDAWSLSGNSTTAADDFLGTMAARPLTLKAYSKRAATYERVRVTGLAGSETMNVVEGYEANAVTAGVQGATISGGGRYDNLAVAPNPNSRPNRVTDHGGTVAGGVANIAGDNSGSLSDASYASVGGGISNAASGAYSTVPGGSTNSASGDYSFAAGCRANAAHPGSFVWSDTTSGCGPGLAEGLSSTADNQFVAKASGGVQFKLDDGGTGVRIQPVETFAPAYGLTGYLTTNWIAGARINHVDEGVIGATIAGGGTWYCPPTTARDYCASPYPKSNSVSGDYGTVSGGSGNSAGRYAAVAGGVGSNASGYASFAVGSGSTASGDYSFAGSGSEASGSHSFAVQGGDAIGDYTFAGGRGARAIQRGSFVWSDATTDYEHPFPAVGIENGVIFKASGGYYLASNVAMDRGAVLRPGEGGWRSASRREVKENFAPVDGQAILERLATIPIETWNYTGQEHPIRHIGPMADDFYGAFGVGEDDGYIGTVDADGVALATIQGLYEIVKENELELEALTGELKSLREDHAKLAQRLAALEARTR